MWVGRPGVASPEHVRLLQEARDRGVSNLAVIARQVADGNAILEERALSYLRDNLKFGLGEAEQAGLRRFHELAAEISVVPELKPLKFF
jgi:chorismate dehydratase